MDEVNTQLLKEVRKHLPIEPGRRGKTMSMSARASATSLSLTSRWQVLASPVKVLAVLPTLAILILTLSILLVTRHRPTFRPRPPTRIVLFPAPMSDCGPTSWMA